MLLLGGSLELTAQGRGTAAAESGMRLQKGSVEVGLIVGTTLPISLFRAHKDRRLTMGSLDVGRVMTHQRGRGPLAGNFEFLLEISPLMVIHQPQHVFGLAASPLHMRWNFAPWRTRRLQAFAEVSGGILYTNHPVPVRTTDFNFIDQVGFGVRFATGPKRAWLAGYRLQHVSNGGRVEPNPGANFNFLYVGVTSLR
jgi:lipid A 3-O-deacylase PagL